MAELRTHLCESQARYDGSQARHARIYEAAARIAAGLVSITVDGEPYKGNKAEEEVVADQAVDLALRLDRAVAEALEGETK